MKAFTLVKYGRTPDSFELRDIEKPKPSEMQVLIQVEAFGLNFADVMARQGLYQDAPPLPAVLGYEVVGRIESVGDKVKGLSVGQRVVALTRFGAYAEFAVTDYRAVVVIPDDMPAGIAASIATQYSTAYYCAYEMAPLFEGQHVLIQAGAGGVGIALIQMAKNKGCTVYATAGSEEKINFMKNLGVDYAINYNQEDFEKKIKSIRGKTGLDVIFDSLGGKAVQKGMRLLGSGGRMICYGVASRAGKSKGILNDLPLAFGFGIFSPIPLLLKSQGIVGVNMLRIADDRPDTLNRCMDAVAKEIQAGKLSPHIGGEFKSDQLIEAHDYLGNRKSMGKIIVHW